MSFKDFLSKSQPASAISTPDLEHELEKREISQNVFPLWCFNEKVQPYINALVNEYDIPRSYVGLALLTAYSTAIGTSYVCSPNGQDANYLAIWGCLSGISSSGKTLAVNMAFRPLYKIQDKFDQEWNENTKDTSLSDLYKEKLKTVVFRDVHIATLVRYVMPDNPKGVCKYADEIMEWINGMNALSKKEGTDEQFWLSSWNCSPYSGIRSGKAKFTVPRPFANVIGGIQPSIHYKLFAKDRDTTGFIFRMLFAIPEISKIAQPESDFSMDQATIELHDHCINRIFKELDVLDDYETPKRVILTKESNALLRAWENKKVAKINAITSLLDQEIHASILGKMKEYAKRFVGILAVVDEAYSHDISNILAIFPNELRATTEVTKRALEIADYFYQSAVDVYEDVRTKVTAPSEVLIAANAFNAGWSYKKISKLLYDTEKHASKVHRNIHKWILEYPKQFKAEAKRS